MMLLAARAILIMFALVLLASDLSVLLTEQLAPREQPETLVRGDLVSLHQYQDHPLQNLYEILMVQSDMMKIERTLRQLEMDAE